MKCGLRVIHRQQINMAPYTTEVQLQSLTFAQSLMPLTIACFKLEYALVAGLLS